MSLKAQRDVQSFAYLPGVAAAGWPQCSIYISCLRRYEAGMRLICRLFAFVFVLRRPKCSCLFANLDQDNSNNKCS